VSSHTREATRGTEKSNCKSFFRCFKGFRNGEERREKGRSEIRTSDKKNLGKKKESFGENSSNLPVPHLFLLKVSRKRRKNVTNIGKRLILMIAQRVAAKQNIYSYHTLWEPN